MDIKLNDAFKSLWDCKDSVIIMWGGRGSGKSDMAASIIVRNLMTHKYFSCIAIRNTYESLADSSFKALCSKISEWGLDSQFTITRSPFKIVHKTNKNEVLFRGLDDVNKLKSLKDPSAVYWEEDIPNSFEDYMTVVSSLRTSKADYIQQIFTINPMIEDYENHWFYKRYFEGHPELSFRTCVEQEINGKIYKQYATILHTNFLDNAFLPPDIALSYEQFKMDEISYQQQYLGLWCNKVVSNQFFKRFNMVKNTWDGKYDPNLALHLSWDFNVEPYSALTIYQGVDKDLRQIDEICLENPKNTLKDTINEFKRRYANHPNGVYIYGDCNGYAGDTKMEKGVNEYSIIFRELAKYRPDNRTTRSNPNVKASGNFVNSIFGGDLPGISLSINSECKRTITDLLNLKEAPDGGTLKEKFRDRTSGKTYEKYGHTSDSLRYCVCRYFEEEYKKFLRGVGNQSRLIKIPKDRAFWY